MHPLSNFNESSISTNTEIEHKSIGFDINLQSVATDCLVNRLASIEICGEYPTIDKAISDTTEIAKCYM